jgi:RimJ/RimL family protein N-acetyltransferase/phospholipid N-methyltransferase
MNYYIKTQRLALREFNLNDVQKVFEFSREESLKKWIPNQCYSDINEAAGIVKLIIGNYMKSELPVVLAVEKSDTAELIGHVGLSGIDEGVEIGYAIGQQYQKSGYASEAVGAFCDWCRSEFKYDKIWGIVKKGNTASCRVLEKTGFTKTGNESTVRDVYVKELKRLEQMSDFFTARVDGYDTHMLNDVKGCKDGYIKMAELVPLHTKTILDLGCGTGLELDEIFKRFPDISVLEIDLTQAMLDKLIQKHSDKNIKLICGSYFDEDFGVVRFDTAVSFQTMHHFSHKDKIRLYEKIRKALKPGGVYIECDYMVTEQVTEDELFAANSKLRREMNLPDGEFYHFDTPCTIGNQIAMFKKAGFISAEMIWRKENTTMIIAKSS